MKNLVKRILGDQLLGMIDFFRHPYRKDHREPFNGQVFRQRIFQELLELFRFSAIVETGAHRGITTEFMYSRSDLPVYAVELQPRYFGYARLKFLLNREMHFSLNDSRAFLRGLSKNPDLKGQRFFFYLDAHWYKDLPLKEELEIIFSNWTNAVVMIDDFKIPDDEGYTYDDYGPRETLSLEYIAELEHLKLVPFFPAKGAQEETGHRRGCVVLAQDTGTVRKLSSATTLRPWTSAAVRPVGQAH